MSDGAVAGPGTALDERYGRREPVAGFLGRATFGGLVAIVLGSLVFGVVAAASSGDGGSWALVAYGLLFVGPVGALIGLLAALCGLAAERLGRTARGRALLLGVVGGAAAGLQVPGLAVLVGGPGNLTPPLLVVGAVSGVLGGLLLVRLRHRSLRRAIGLRTRAGGPPRGA